MPVRQADIAKIANVSTATVSRILNNVDGVFIAEKTRELVLEIAREMGYTPNCAARALVTGRTNVVALWMPGVALAYFSQVIDHVQKTAWREGFDVITSEYGEQTSRRPDETNWPVDGILAYNGGEWLRNAIVNSPVSSKPFVSLGSLPADVGDVVRVSLRPAAKKAVRHLLDEGCQRVVHLIARSTSPPGEERREAYVDAMEDAGLEPEFVTCLDGTRASARMATVEYCKAHGCPDAIFCANDLLAMGAYRGLRDIGARVPDDVALVGCDGIEDTEYVDTPISTIVQPVDEMCRIAWQFLQDRVADPTIEMREVNLNADFVVRESSCRNNGRPDPGSSR